MKRSEVNKDPDRARKRARADLRCAWRKLGSDAPAVLADLLVQLGPEGQAQASALLDLLPAVEAGRAR